MKVKVIQKMKKMKKLLTSKNINKLFVSIVFPQIHDKNKTFSKPHILLNTIPCSK